MELLSPLFVILIVKMLICVMPGVLGVVLLVSSEEKKRSMRNSLCNQLFGISNAIEFNKFERFLSIVAVLAIIFTLVASWFILLSELFFPE